MEVTLGKGGGHNWWCVLYPNMCFQGAVYEVVDEEADEALREVLTPEEYADVFDSGKLEKKTVIRFKRMIMSRWIIPDISTGMHLMAVLRQTQ